MDKALIFMAMAGYMSIIIGIGFYYYKRSNESSDNSFWADAVWVLGLPQSVRELRT